MSKRLLPVQSGLLFVEFPLREGREWLDPECAAGFAPWPHRRCISLERRRAPAAKVRPPNTVSAYAPGWLSRLPFLPLLLLNPLAPCRSHQAANHSSAPEAWLRGFSAALPVATLAPGIRHLRGAR